MLELVGLLPGVGRVEYVSIIMLSSVVHCYDGARCNFVAGSLLDDVKRELVLLLLCFLSFSHNGGAFLHLHSIGNEEPIEQVSVFCLRAHYINEVVCCYQLALPEGVDLTSELLGDEVLDVALGFSPFFDSGVTVHFGVDHPVQLRDVDGVLVQIGNSVAFR